MNKMEFVSALSVKAECSKKDAEKFLNAFIDCVTETLQKNDKVQLVGFGTFEVVDRAQRVCRNPQSGGTMTIPATRVPRFKVGKNLKDAVAKTTKKKK